MSVRVRLFMPSRDMANGTFALTGGSRDHVTLPGLPRRAKRPNRFVCVLDFCAAARSVPCFGTVS